MYFKYKKKTSRPLQNYYDKNAYTDIFNQVLSNIFDDISTIDPLHSASV